MLTDLDTELAENNNPRGETLSWSTADIELRQQADDPKIVIKLACETMAIGHESAAAARSYSHGCACATVAYIARQHGPQTPATH